MGLDPEGYGNPDFCWLALHDSLVWSLVGPCAAALAVRIGLGAGEGMGPPITLLTPCTPRSASSSWCWQPGPPVPPPRASRKRAQRESPKRGYLQGAGDTAGMGLPKGGMGGWGTHRGCGTLGARGHA